MNGFAGFWRQVRTCGVSESVVQPKRSKSLSSLMPAQLAYAYSSPASRNSQAGFTLIELLLSVAIITIVAGLSMPLYLSFTQRNDLDVATNGLVETLRRAETYSRAVNGDSQWAVEIQPTAATLFKGTSFASRNTGFDEAVSIPATVTVSGLSEVVFSKVTGLPTTTGSITLTLDSNNVRTVSINSKGMVDY